MKFLLPILSLVLSVPSFAVDFQCDDLGLQKVTEYLEYSSTDEFLSENFEIFFCRSKEEPIREILQWGDGSGLVGIEFEVQNGQCVVVEEPYTGQDDQDLDVEWAKSYCQDFE